MMYEEWLAHFNPNHDPRNGQFASSKQSLVSKSIFKKDVVKYDNEPVEFHLRDNSQFAKILAKILPSVQKTIDTAFSYDIKDKSGNNVGYLELEKLNPQTLYGSWISINEKQRGQGYAQSAMRMILNEAKANGFEKMTLEVPGNSPDARHVYEKYGFQISKDQYNIDPDDVWGGLTRMERKL